MAGILQAFFNPFSLMEILVFWFTYDYSLVPKVMAGQHWLSGEEHLRSHYLYQWWLSLLRHLCVTQLWCLTHWGRVTHICVSKLTIIGRRQAIIWTNDGISLIGSLGTNFREILVEILTFSFKKMHLKISSAKWRPFCLGTLRRTKCQPFCRWHFEIHFLFNGNWHIPI